VKTLYLGLVCLIAGIRVTSSGEERPDGPPPELGRFAWMIGVWETTATYRFLPDLPTLELQSTETEEGGEGSYLNILTFESDLDKAAGWIGLFGWNLKGRSITSPRGAIGGSESSQA
jgi:hypothetical protein